LKFNHLVLKLFFKIEKIIFDSLKKYRRKSQKRQIWTVFSSCHG